jgi:putative endonuclease
MAAKDELGARGEEIATRELLALGWSVLARNWRPAPGRGLPRGEIDIVAQDGPELVIVEVKTRSSRTFGGAVEAVTRAKLARLRRLAAAWLASQERRIGPAAIDGVRIDGLPFDGVRIDGVRIDIVCIDIGRDGRPRVEILRGVE